MKFVSIIILLVLAGCSQKSNEKEKLITSTLWITADIKIDTTEIDSTIYARHGSGRILNFDSEQKFSSFSNTFYFANDSIWWGEPGPKTHIGKWEIDGNQIILQKELVDAMIFRRGEKIGDVSHDTFQIRGDTLVRQDGEKFVSTQMVSTDIRHYLKKGLFKKF